MNKISGKIKKILYRNTSTGLLIYAIQPYTTDNDVSDFNTLLCEGCVIEYRIGMPVDIYYEKTKERDLAIVTLLLGTGIRVSECVGLDIEDVDFKNNGIKVTRKGGNEMVVYFGHEVEKALKKYLEVRKNIVPVAGHEHALFYSTQRKRIGIQAVENLVKKYAGAITTTKKITPHKLRSTYGTTLYQETGDIYLVADVLGHRDVNTTKKHYAAMDDARRRKAATAVHLRED